MKLNTILKSAFLLIAAGSLAACGGGGGSVETLQTKLNSVIVNNHIDLSVFDKNGDGNLTDAELISVYRTLDAESKSLILSAYNVTESQAEAFIKAFNNQTTGIYKLNSDINIFAAHAAGITGTGVNIAVLDGFKYGVTHGSEVKRVVDGLAVDSEVYAVNIACSNGKAHFDCVDKNDHWKLEQADIVNMSFGGYIDFSAQGISNTSLQQAYNDAAKWRNPDDTWGNLVVVAAGNEGQEGKDCSTLDKCNGHAVVQHILGETVIAVGALNDKGTALENYSNPAGLLKDIYISAPVSNNGNSLAGTSYAAPYVTGTAALIMDKYNTNATQTRNIIFDTADDLGAPGVDSVYGQGRLNVGAALSPIGNLN